MVNPEFVNFIFVWSFFLQSGVAGLFNAEFVTEFLISALEDFKQVELSAGFEFLDGFTSWPDDIAVVKVKQERECSLLLDLQVHVSLQIPNFGLHTGM